MHCRTLHPMYRQVALDYKDNDDIIFARMDLSEHKPLDLKVWNHNWLQIPRDSIQAISFERSRPQKNATSFFVEVELHFREPVSLQFLAKMGKMVFLLSKKHCYENRYSSANQKVQKHRGRDLIRSNNDAHTVF